MDSYAQQDSAYHVLVTGANSGLGYAICCRLIDEFLHTRPPSQSLVLIVTTRSKAKAEDTLQRLRIHLRDTARRRNPASPALETGRIELHYALVDLLRLHSVRAAAATLCRTFPKLDAVILNAGMGGWIRVDWLKAARALTRNFVEALTWPDFKVSAVGLLAKPQLSSRPTAHGTGSAGEQREPVLGEVFTANVFGHYLLVRGLMPLLSHSLSGPAPARIIWTSSVEAYASAFSISDPQCLKSPRAYEGTKRLTDLLALSSTLPSTAPWTSTYFALPPAEEATHPPRMYLSHPGICATSIMPLPLVLAWLFLGALYVARLFGGVWQTIWPYTGACSAVWLALSPAETLERVEAQGAGKWGSAADVVGGERVEKMEVEGWGVGGVVGDEGAGRARRRGRWVGMTEVTREGREGFEVLGRECWREMEALRGLWEGLLAEDEGELGSVAVK